MNNSIRPAIYAFMVLALLPNLALGKSPKVEVPFLYEDNRIYVQISSTKGPLGWFILDTGISEALIETSVQTELGLPVLSSETAHGAGVGQLSVANSHATTLLLGKMSLQVPTTRIAAISKVLAPYGGREISGIIGGALFREHVVTIDFERNRIDIREANRFQYRGKGIVVPFHLTNGVPLVDGNITLPDQSQLTARLLIDLGAKSTLLLSQPFVDEHKLPDRMAPSVIEPLGAGLGGETRYAFVRVPQLTVGQNVRLSDFIAGLSFQGTLRGGYYDALLGVPALRQYRVTIDYSRQHLILEPNSQRDLPRFDESGIFVVANSDSLQIHYVVPGSPGAEVGLQPGDVVQRINNVLVSKNSLVRVRALLAGTETDTVGIVVLRNGVQISTSIHLRKLL